jgi:hypothetical protein
MTDMYQRTAIDIGCGTLVAEFHFLGKSFLACDEIDDAHSVAQDVHGHLVVLSDLEHFYEGLRHCFTLVTTLMASCAAGWGKASLMYEVWIFGGKMNNMVL